MKYGNYNMLKTVVKIKFLMLFMSLRGVTDQAVKARHKIKDLQKKMASNNQTTFQIIRKSN